MIIQANTLHIPLKDESVHCVVTSPPYFGLRRYQIPDSIWDGDPDCKHEWGDFLPNPMKPYENQVPQTKYTNSSSADGQNAKAGQFCLHCSAWRGQLGLEPTIDLYLRHLLQVMDECKRVLRDDGTMWVNLGDSYSGSWGNYGSREGGQREVKEDRFDRPGVPPKNFLPGTVNCGIPPKSLCLIPERFAVEMVNRGWILRNKIIWKKANCMPSSAKDRFTVDFEDVFFFCKSKEKSNDVKEWLPEPISKENRSWLAAMIDAEGSIGIRYSKTDRPHGSFGAYLTVSNSNYGLVQKCLDITKSGTIKDLKAQTNFKMWRWEVTHNKAISVLAEIYPYLIAKREQTKVAFALQKTNFRRGSPKGSNKGTEQLTEKEYQEKIALWELGKKLNQRQVENSNLPELNLNRFSGCEDYWFEQQYESHISTDKKPHGTFGQKSLAAGEKIKIELNPQGRNRRCVWTIPTQPYSEAHFATFPEALVEPMIKAGTSEKGCCPKCGSPWKREVEKTFVPQQDVSLDRGIRGATGQKPMDASSEWDGVPRGSNVVKTIGWQPTCSCDAGDPVPCVVMDPFAGSGTTGVVAEKLNRRWVGLDLGYLELQQERLVGIQKEMPLIG